jgi:hypothetical protein
VNRRLLTRVVLLVAALAVMGWTFGAMRSTDAYNEAIETSARIQFGAAGDGRQARDAIDRSRRFGPDTRAVRARAFLLLATRHPRRAAAVAERVIGREPDNLDAWGILYEATRQFDRRRSREALRRARELNPLTGWPGI